MHRLQPAIDVCPLEEDAMLVASAPALANAWKDIVHYIVDLHDGQYDLATLGVLVSRRYLLLRDELDQMAQGMKMSSLNLLKSY